MANIRDINNRFEENPGSITDEELEQLLATAAENIARYVIHGDIYPERKPQYASLLDVAKRQYRNGIHEAATRALAGSSVERAPSTTFERQQDDRRPAITLAE